MDKLNELLKSYLDITCEILDSIEKDRFDNLGTLLSKRQEYLDKLKSMKFKGSEIERAVKENNLFELEDNIKSLIIEKQKDLIQKMNKLSDANRAVTGYKRNKNYYDADIYNEKI